MRYFTDYIISSQWLLMVELFFGDNEEVQV